MKWGLEFIRSGVFSGKYGRGRERSKGVKGVFKEWIKMKDHRSWAP